MGAAGPAGPAGANGTNGTNGTVWLSGAGVPAMGLGVDGDWYLETTYGGVYKKAGGAWSLVYKTTIDLAGTNTNLNNVLGFAQGGTTGTTQQTAIDALLKLPGFATNDIWYLNGSGHVARLAAPSAPTTKFFRGDMSWQVPAGIMTLHTADDTIQLDARRGGAMVQAHSASVGTIAFVRWSLLCTDAGGDPGGAGTYLQNDELEVFSVMEIIGVGGDASFDYDTPFATSIDGTNLVCAVNGETGNNALKFNVMKKDGSADFDIALTKWKLRVRWGVIA